MFSTDFIFRQQENLVDNQKCQAGFRPLCNKILFLTIGQNNFENKIPIFCSVQSQENDNYDFELLLGSRELLRISHDDYYFPASYLLEHQYFSNFLKRTLRMFAIISKKYRIDIISFDMKFEH